MKTPALFTMAQSSPEPQSVDTANYARVNPLPSPATPFSSSGELHLYIESDRSSPSIHVGPPTSSQEPLLQGDHTVSHPYQSSQRLPRHQRTLSLQLFFPGLIKWPQQNSQATPHQRRSSQIGRTLVESVDQDHNHNHWFIHQRLCIHLTHNVHPYHHRGTARQYLHSDHIIFFPSHPSTIDRRRQTTIPSLTLHPGDAHELQNTNFIQFIPLSYRLHNRLCVTLQAP